MTADLFGPGSVGEELDAEIAEAAREVAMRERVYPGWVKAGKMTQHQADRRLGLMRAILKRLKDLKTEYDMNGGVR